MLSNYIFEYKLFSFKNVKIVLLATFVNKSDIRVSKIACKRKRENGWGGSCKSKFMCKT